MLILYTGESMQRKILLFFALPLGLAVVGILLMRYLHPAGDPGLASREPAQPRAGADSAEADPEVGPENAAVGSSGAGHQALAEVRALEILNLFEDWLKLLADNEGAPAGSLADSLSARLRRNPNGNEAFYRRARQLLNDPSIPPETKQALVHLLGRAATVAAAHLLIDLYRQDLPEDIKQALRIAISNVGDYYWDPSSFPQVSPILLQAWREAQDPQLLNALALAIAKVGHPDGISQLFEAIQGQGTTLTEIQKSGDVHALAAWQALERLHIPVIEKRMYQSGGGSAEISICAGILASMGQIEATQALLSWAQGAGDSYVPLIREAFGKVQDRESLDFLNSALAQNAKFKSTLVWQTVAATLKKK